MDLHALIAPVIIAVVPIVLAVGKRALGSATWLIPPIAAGLGALADALAAYLTNVPVTPHVGMALGLAGVGLRELVDQMKKASGP
jgi:hypothetical protein